MITFLPPSAKMQLRDPLYSTQLEVFRFKSDWPNIQYHIQLLLNCLKDCRGADTLVAKAVTICKQNAQHRLEKLGSWLMTANGLCFVRTNALGFRIQRQLGCHFYHSDLDHLRRNQVIITLSQNRDPYVLFAVAAWRASIYNLSICLIVHVDAPGWLINHLQKTARDGQNGLFAVWIILTVVGWALSWDSGYQSDSLKRDWIQLNYYLQSRISICQCLTG